MREVPEFLHIAVGATKITNAFWITCPDCLEPFSSEGGEVDYILPKIKQIDTTTRIVEVYSFDNILSTIEVCGKIFPLNGRYQSMPSTYMPFVTFGFSLANDSI
jgi:hypothetical protein